MIQGLPQFTDILSSFLLSNLNENVQNFKVVQNVSAEKMYLLVIMKKRANKNKR
jgi:hypothetical protein